MSQAEHSPNAKRLKSSPTSSSASSAAEPSVAKVVSDHYNAVDNSNRISSNVFHLRNFNNLIKSLLMDEVMSEVSKGKKYGDPLVGLDLCCGKGGDIFKWDAAHATHVIFTDIADKCLDACRDRYECLKRRKRGRSSIFRAQFICENAFTARLRGRYQDPSIRVDVATCHFALHYSFESMAMAECLLWNATDCLRPGGFFIGTILDSNELVARLRKSDTNSFGNGVFSATFHQEWAAAGAEHPPPLFGAEYKFNLANLVNCPEFIVHFPTLVELAKKYGLKLVRKEKFADFYQRSFKSGMHLLRKIHVFEVYPPRHKSDLVGSAADDYKHAEEYLQARDLGKGAQIGTLSRSEWEVITLYCVFVFQKEK